MTEKKDQFMHKKKIQLIEVGRAIFEKIPTMTEEEKQKVAIERKMLMTDCKKCRKKTYDVTTIFETRCLTCGCTKED